MTKTAIKQDIFNLVEKVEDKHLLEQIKELVEYMAKDTSISWESLSDAEKKSIEEGLDDIKNGRVIDYGDLKLKYPKWFGK